MTYRNKEDQAAAARRHYEKNKDAIKARAAAYTRKVREDINAYLREIKETSPCADCGQQFPHYVMDFDHLGDKEFTLAYAGKLNKSLTAIKAEVAKCEVVCSNCHRIRTWNRAH